MRYYLDTNLLVFILSNQKDCISREVADIVFDFSNILYAGSVAVNELILLYKTGKVILSDCNSAKDIIPKIEQSGIEIVYYNPYHLEKYIALDIADSHKEKDDTNTKCNL
ncbi:hypothetical protein Barb6_02283 [Bacteroidales bacterium Barb6]|nr:hypothetical protein Barb6_02283 [Bacteroidales bacterium Barb6]